MIKAQVTKRRYFCGWSASCSLAKLGKSLRDFVTTTSALLDPFRVEKTMFILISSIHRKHQRAAFILYQAFYHFCDWVVWIRAFLLVLSLERSRNQQLISVKDWGDRVVAIMKVQISCCLWFSMHNVIIYFLFYGEEIKCSRGMRTCWRGTWCRTIMYSTLLGWKWQPCLLFGKFSCFRLTWFVMECKDRQYLVRFLFRKNTLRFLCL